MFPEVTLVTPTREDVQRISDWLDDSEVNEVWFGIGENGKPLHATYEPAAILAGGTEEWDHIFNDESRVTQRLGQLGIHEMEGSYSAHNINSAGWNSAPSSP